MGAFDATTSVTDGVTDNLAQYHNELKTAADHAMSAAAYAAYGTPASMTGNVTLTDASLPILSYAPTAARDLTLPAVATTNHAFYVINRSGTYAITVKDAAAATITTVDINSTAFLVSDGANNWYPMGGGGTALTKAAYTDVATGTDDDKYVTSKAIKDSVNVPNVSPVGGTGNVLTSNGTAWTSAASTIYLSGWMINGKLSVTVASNNLTVTVKTLAGADPSAGDPVNVRIGNVVHSITAALSITKNAGTNYCNAGGAELATVEVDYFVYLGYNATDGVVIGFSRIPYANQYSTFSATSTDEKYAAISTITNVAATDYYNVVGRFAATLSAGAGYTWSVPTFTATNLISRPIFESRILAWTTTITSGLGTVSSATITKITKYKISDNKVYFITDVLITDKGVGTPTASVILSLPFIPSANSGYGGREEAVSCVSLSCNVLTSALT